ncbi:MAG: LysR substrate-binding domain-containing protein [Polyangiales bacterium]
MQQLRYLVALDSVRSFRDAAAVCHVSQPALSTQVKKVEDLLGVCIFDRSRQPIMPTERGVKILGQARCALEQFDRIGLIAAEPTDIAGSYRLGVIPTLAATMLPLFVPRFVQQYPRVSLEIVETKTEALVRSLREGTLDAGLAATPLGLPGVREHVICRETFYAYLPQGHRLCDQRSVSESDLLDEQLWLLADGHCFRTQVLALCSSERRSHTEAIAQLNIDVGSFETLVGFVDAGLGVTVLPELFVRRLPERVRSQQVRRFHAPQPVREIGFLYAREHLRWGVFSALLGEALEAVPAALSESSIETVRVVAPVEPGQPAPPTPLRERASST